MGHVYWEQFSWEAFATLGTGAMAVVGAVFIGLRQIGIAKRQSEITGRQVALAALSAKVEVFDRRWAVYDSTREFVSAIMRHAAEPDQQVQQAFLIGLNKAKFLFEPRVYCELKEIWDRSCQFFAVQSDSQHLFQTTGAYGQENIEKRHAYLIWINSRLENLAAIFGAELRLSESS